MNSTSNTSNSDISVTRTYRVAMKLGEDYVTLEETITLPPNASDEDIQHAVNLGWRIYHAQNEAVEKQTNALREAWRMRLLPPSRRRAETPASEKQRNYLAILQRSLAWSDDDLLAYAQKKDVDLQTMTRAQAMELIDGLMELVEEQVLPHTHQTKALADLKADTEERTEQS